ncbi:MAG: OmpA family protein [Leptospirales bacterium]
MARKMKTSGKVIIGFVVVTLLYIGLKSTDTLDVIFPSKPNKASSVPIIDSAALPGTNVVRLGHWTWNSHQAWAYANQGKVTKANSIFAKHGISLGFNRMEEIPNQIAALVAFASSLNEPTEDSNQGIHFFTIMGDAGGWILNDTNKALKGTGYTAEIIGFSGFSSGEDKFMGPPSWKKDPNNAKGGLVAGVAADGDWNIMIFWCAQNNIPFNPDQRYYDPEALNFIHTDSYLKAAEVYIAGKPIELKFKTAGKDYQGNPVEEGDTGGVLINGSVTWTPGDKNIADQRGGLVSIVSTKEYSNQMPQYIVGLKEWDENHRSTVENMLAAIFEAADEILTADQKLKKGQIKAKSSQDKRWEAAKYVKEIFGSESADYWYKYYDVVKVKDITGLTVEIGGSSVSNLQRNLTYFGLGGGTDIGEIVYNQFAKLAMYYYPDFMDGYPNWTSVFNPSYLQGVLSRYPSLASSSAYLPTFTKSQGSKELIGDMTYNIEFDSGQASFKSGAGTTLREVLEQLVIAANSRVEIHGHTDSQGKADANMNLSRKRGDAVYSWLRKNAGSSFPKNRVRVIPHGENQLLGNDVVNGDPDPAQMARNRRVVIKVYAN